MIEQRHHIPNVSIEGISLDFKEAYLEFYGINHLRPSYTAWVFFSNRLPKKVSTASRGFAGALYVFGHSECWGDQGHCHGVDGLRRFDSRPSNPMTRAFKRVPVGGALKRELKLKKSTVDLSIFVFSKYDWNRAEDNSLLCCQGMQIVTV